MANRLKGLLPNTISVTIVAFQPESLQIFQLIFHINLKIYSAVLSRNATISQTKAYSATGP
ncbi:MAG: hypothetical protein A3I91_03240 [Candidatus Kerfeldbacteria bacterium RIFCSPLOWO2_02_FULL_42_19]|nr:MAG: hypothetical protein A3I91_03240 [Candidatus Kerfeldbacteria bacterium RIFCSPLOWO2_02_FULL_42_19]